MRDGGKGERKEGRGGVGGRDWIKLRSVKEREGIKMQGIGKK